MSPLRVVICAFIGVGLFLVLVAIFAAGLPHPLFRGIVAFVTLSGGGFAIFYMVFRGLRDGVISYGYSRENNPVSFWLYIALGAVCGTVACAFAIYCLVNHAQIFDTLR